MHNIDTICAISTAQGGAIGCIRISGSEAISIASKIFTPINKNKKLEEVKPYSIVFGKIFNGDEVVDEVLVSIFKAPHSYTGENSVEIACHGSSYIMQEIMRLLISNGCRLAQPGEYTQRAFLNGKMDLSQAEAVADLIASTNASTHRIAMSQMRGGFSKELRELREKLITFTSMVELELDFSEEDVEFADRNQLMDLCENIDQRITKLINSFRVGNVIKNGIPVAIIGETNAGKSTLLNLLLHEDKAIVSDIHGTTRDVLEDTININGVTFRFIDTAGIRETTDVIESIGIERTFQKLSQSEIVLLVIDSTEKVEKIKQIINKVQPYCNDKQLILVLNKEELINQSKKEDIASLIHSLDKGTVNEFVFISAKEQRNTNELETLLIKTANLPKVTQNDTIVTNIRHYDALVKAKEAIDRVKEGITTRISGDFLSQDIREVIHHISDIAGEVTNDMVLQNIFKNF
ncbi:MAG: tRNA uridine-5-carboxymethylaminomethyl(34) synthesis GTPase MnmE, partial [Bacteroides sp.]|nr:tRNA uridine-5-carboxymethylaminomethyl(34) synthesis GTPase MnmE [Bacteroides sp.]